MPRTYPRDTPLAKRMEVLGFQVNELSAVTGINRWRLNDYLHARRRISTSDMFKLTAALSCEPETIAS